MIYTISYIAGGFLAGWIARSQLEKRLRGGNLGQDPLVFLCSQPALIGPGCFNPLAHRWRRS